MESFCKSDSLPFRLKTEPSGAVLERNIHNVNASRKGLISG
jgi:hypothetical protein